MKTAKETITVDDDWVPCWICDNIFKRKRGTLTYCSTCEQGFCKDEHGKFHHGTGKCVMCLVKESNQEKP